MSQYSVALCTYNGEKYLEEQLRSIISQTIRPSQIVISDDGSSDRTLQVAENVLSRCNIDYQIVRNERAKGVTGNFCNAISLCKCEFVFTSDQDDVWIENKAETIISVFKHNPDALLVFSDGFLVDENLNPMNSNMWTSVGISKKMLTEQDWFSYLLNRCLVTGAAMAFKKELFDADEEIPESWLHDGWLAWKAVARNGLVACDKKLIKYRQHRNNVVGMTKLTSMKRVRNYFMRFNGQTTGRSVRYDRYVALNEKMGNLFSKEQQQALQECISFWGDLLKAKTTSKKSDRALIIVRNWTNGNFKKYASGSRGAFRALVTSLKCE